MQKKLIFLPSWFHMSVLLTSLTFILKRETAMCQANPLTIFSLILEWPLLFYPQRMFFLLNVTIMLFLENLPAFRPSGIYMEKWVRPIGLIHSSSLYSPFLTLVPLRFTPFRLRNSDFILLFPWSDFFLSSKIGWQCPRKPEDRDLMMITTDTITVF